MIEAEICCGTFYDRDVAGMFLGDVWHPGGSNLTGRLASQINARSNELILDVGCGIGATSRLLSEQFGCRVVGLDLSSVNARDALRQTGKNELSFLAADAHHIPVVNKLFDGAVIECALSTFHQKPVAINELARVLKTGGRLGMSDVVVEGEIPEELKSPLMNAFCVGGALSLDEYRKLLEEGGFKVIGSENKKQETLDFLEQVRRKLFVVKLLVGVGKIKLDSRGLDYAHHLLSLASKSAQEGRLGYATLVASRSD